MTEPKYPEINVSLVGEDGNAFSILGRCNKAMRRAGLDEQSRKDFYDEATEGDYDHLLQTVMSWFNTDGDDEDV